MTPMTPPPHVIWLTLAAMVLPLVSFGVVFIFTRPRVFISCAISLACSTVSLVVAWYLLLSLHGLEQPLAYKVLWFKGGAAQVTYGFLLDPLSLLMLCIVATISFLIQVYSLGYMDGDPGQAKFYAFLSLFAWSMIGLVVAHDIMQLYIFWELVGLSSYLLIGFWHEKFSASQAGKKAFVMTRLGDLGFFLGIIILLLNLGDITILGINQGAALKLTPALVTTSALLIFCGVVGKSAQFPLLTWLPDAMEGPTPVSALLHSATMVAAGVYLVSRLYPLFAASPTALLVVLAVGAVTMLLSSTMAMVADDLKQVWAYSTVSQLGFMLMALGAGGYFAGVFHLTTHAAFKALLFLCSGVFIHHFGSNDMFSISRAGGRGLRVPMITITIAGAALAGVFPLAGFYSKEEIMGVLAGAGGGGLWLGAGLLGAFLTAYYTFRLLFVLWFPRAAEPAAEGHGHDDHGHDDHGSHGAAGYWAMAAALVVLACFTVLLGLWREPLLHSLHWGKPPAEAHHTAVAALAIILVLLGVGLAWLEFGRKGASQKGFISRVPALETLFASRWYLDHLYRWLLDRVVYGIFSRVCTLNDRRVVDGAIDGACRGAVGLGWLLSFVQSGLLQYNLFTMALIIAVVGLYFLLV